MDEYVLSTLLRFDDHVEGQLLLFAGPLVLRMYAEKWPDGPASIGARDGGVIVLPLSDFPDLGRLSVGDAWDCFRDTSLDEVPEGAMRH